MRRGDASWGCVTDCEAMPVRLRAATRCARSCSPIGDDYWIEDEQGRRAFKVDGKAVRIRDTFVLRGRRRAARSPRSRSASCACATRWRSNATAATPPSTRRWWGCATGSRSTSTADRTCSAHGNLVDHEYEIERDGDTVADGVEEVVPGQGHLRRRDRAGPGRRVGPGDHGVHRRDDARLSRTADRPGIVAYRGVEAADMNDSPTLADPFTVPTRHWHRLDDGRVQCDVCPRACRLHEGQRGLCFVRARVDDMVVLTTYGRSSGFCVDPVEKKPLNHFLPGTPVLSFGTAGCNLACKFCQNWDISKSREIDTLADQASPAALAELAQSLDCRSVAFTYNDPVIFWEYAVDVADACRERGVKAIAVTAGYMCPQPRQEFYRHIDAANVDLKAFTRGLLPPGVRGQARRRPRHAALPAPRDRRVAGDHDAAHPWPQRQRRGDRRGDQVDRQASSGPTCRCTSRRSTPTTRCSTSRGLRRRR